MPKMVEVGDFKLTDDMAALLHQRIQEFESQKLSSREAQKNPARLAAKVRLREAKHLVANPELSDEKVPQLWRMLDAEREKATRARDAAVKALSEITAAEEERAACKLDLRRVLVVRGNLQRLCMDLEQRVAGYFEERKRTSEAEQLRRQQKADEFQTRVAEVKRQMSDQAEERFSLSQTNQSHRLQIKSVFEEYDREEKNMVSSSKAAEQALASVERQLMAQAEVYKTEGFRESKAIGENEALTQTQQALQSQLQTYGQKFSEFNASLSKSDKVLGQYVRQRNKMQRHVEILEKENAELMAKNERRVALAVKERGVAMQEKEAWQERCKALQAERLALSDEPRRAGASGGEPGRVVNDAGAAPDDQEPCT